jgi:hypothetical protein
VTKINKEYTFNCAVCNHEVDFGEVEKGGTFTAYELKCGSCSHKGFMFAVFVPTVDDLGNLIVRYKSLIQSLEKVGGDK